MRAVAVSFVQEVQDNGACHIVSAGDEVAAPIVSLRPCRRDIGSYPFVGSVILLLKPEQVKEYVVEQIGPVVSGVFVDGQFGPVHRAS